MIRSIIVLFVTFAFTSLASAQPVTSQPAPPAKKSAAKRAPSKAAAAPASETGPCIGVIPVVGDTFGVQRVGITVLGNEFTEIPIAWGLDDLVVARVRAAAPRGFVVKRIPFAKSAFDPFYKRSFFREPGNDLVDIVRRIASSAGCERYVVVTKWSSRFSSKNQSVMGVGLVQWKGPFNSTTLLFAITNAIVYERDFTKAKQAFVQVDDRNMIARSLVDVVMGPNRELDESAWPDQPAAADTPKNRDIARALLTEGLDKTLPALLAQ
ncbi:MAG TPA: hypothetical protein VF467_17410 [Afipia sp.]